MALSPEELSVETFPTGATLSSLAGGDCCTGCTSGCGYYPTEGLCESNSGDAVCPAADTVAAVE